MLLQDSQGRSLHLSKNRYRINISTVAWEYERNIQPISQWYAGWPAMAECFTYVHKSQLTTQYSYCKKKYCCILNSYVTQYDTIMLIEIFIS